MYGGVFDTADTTQRLQDITDTMNADPDLWNDAARSADLLREKKQLEDKLAKSEKIDALNSDIAAALELATDGEEFLEEAINSLNDLQILLDAIETESLLGGEADQCHALVTINAGAGGTESCDWASMLMRMYLRFAARKQWDVEIHDVQDGDEAGIRSATLELRGEFAFGILNAESGVHRLVRISPFDSNARRHTSFASIYVTPVIDDNIEIEVNPADLRVDTYRASGAGGQHVNRTDSAVRLTHEPSGVVVQCQSQRSQHQNRETAMKMLRSRLYEIELEKRQAKQKELENSKSEIGFGSQIRSYVLHPYKMVKDHRTAQESHSPEQVLDGDIMAFIQSFLQKNAVKL
ncbi:MAG: peptide chain release factor 2 [Oligoflexales bacterium]